MLWNVGQRRSQAPDNPPPPLGTPAWPMPTPSAPPGPPPAPFQPIGLPSPSTSPTDASGRFYPPPPPSSGYAPAHAFPTAPSALAPAPGTDPDAFPGGFGVPTPRGPGRRVSGGQQHLSRPPPAPTAQEHLSSHHHRRPAESTPAPAEVGRLVNKVSKQDVRVQASSKPSKQQQQDARVQVKPSKQDAARIQVRPSKQEILIQAKPSKQDVRISPRPSKQDVRIQMKPSKQDIRISPRPSKQDLHTGGGSSSASKPSKRPEGDSSSSRLAKLGARLHHLGLAASASHLPLGVPPPVAVAGGAKPTASVVTPARPSVVGATKHARHSAEDARGGFEYSSCTGRKRALCIGINYTGTSRELYGCVNDARNVRRWLIAKHGFQASDIVLLTDGLDAKETQLPTRANMLTAMRWLVKGACKNDSLFFHYSGHGAQTRDKDGDEPDGFDEVVFPVDYKRAGYIIDDDMHALMVRPLPSGCRLTALFDSCHSSSALDLPYLYRSNGRIKGLQVTDRALESRRSRADVISFSACKDDQTSADTYEDGKAVGALSYALMQSLRDNHQNITYVGLLKAVREILHSKYSQTAQLSSSHPVDMTLGFVL